MALCKGGCGWDLEVLGPPMGTTEIPDLGGYCADCLPCKMCGKPVGECGHNADLAPLPWEEENVGQVMLSEVQETLDKAKAALADEHEGRYTEAIAMLHKQASALHGLVSRW